MSVTPESVKGNKRWGKLIARIGLTASLLLVPFLAANEGVVTKTYKDIGGVPTVCAGETDPRYAVPGVTYTYEQCLDMLAERLPEYADGVVACTPVVLGDPEVTVAAIDLAYNIGVGAWCKSTAARLLNEGRLLEGCQAMTRFRYVKGKEIKGLMVRREKDLAFCLRGAENMRRAGL